MPAHQVAVWPFYCSSSLTIVSLLVANTVEYFTFEPSNLCVCVYSRDYALNLTRVAFSVEFCDSYFVVWRVN